jgi:stalled ribosome alternative rescue factor ArfA
MRSKYRHSRSVGKPNRFQACLEDVHVVVGVELFHIEMDNRKALNLAK